MFAFVLNNPFPSREEKEKGLKAKLIEDIRWLRCDIKTTSLLGNILLNDDAVTSGYQTTILSRNGVITEGSTANVFVVTPDGTIKTPPLNQLCLPGVTRYITLELINQLNWSVAESEFSENELFGAQEVWITSTTKEIFPVTQINDKIIGKGVGGVYWQKIEPLYQNLIS